MKRPEETVSPISWTVCVGVVFVLLAGGVAASAKAEFSGQGNSVASAQFESSVVPQGRIIGGVESKEGEYPWMVAIVKDQESNDFLGQFCAGTLVRPDWVLTAAHCVTDDSGNPRTVLNLVAVIGKHDLFSITGERIPVARIVVHPEYDSQELLNDIALLELSHSSQATPVTLVGTSFNNPAVAPGTVGRALGWGRMSSTSPQFPSALREVDLPVVANSQCEAWVSSLAAQFDLEPFPVVDSMLCSGNTPGQDTCEGDSGGPFLMQGAPGWIQIGITSFGPGCEEPGVFGFYTRVSKFVPWISDVTCSSAELPGDPVANVAVNGRQVTLSTTEESNASGYRLYFAPFPDATGIYHVDLGPATTLTVPLSSGDAFYVAFEAYDGSCNSPFSNVEYFVIP